MVRYFMTDARGGGPRAHLGRPTRTATAGARRRRPPHADERASVYVLKMGQPVRIYDLAERMIRLAGFEPGEDIDIVGHGHRGPGERLHEILFAREEPMAEIGIDGVMAAKPVFADRPQVEGGSTRSTGRSRRGDRARGRAGVRGGRPGVQAAGAAPSARAEPAPPRVATAGCHPQRLSAAGLATSDAGEPARTVLAPGEARSRAEERPAGPG